MLDYSILNRTKDVANVGVTIATSPSHFGRDGTVLPWSSKSSFGVHNGQMLNLAAQYYDGLNFDGFLQTVRIPYLKTKSADYFVGDQMLTDPGVPKPKTGQAESLIAKYMGLTGTTYQGLYYVPYSKTDEKGKVVGGGLMAEMHPYWERMNVDTMIQNAASKAGSADATILGNKYFTDGISSVKSILQNKAYINSQVAFVAKQSNDFLKLNTNQKIDFSTMTMEKQYEFVLIAENQKAAFIQQNKDQWVLADGNKMAIAAHSLKPGIDIDSYINRFADQLKQQGKTNVDVVNEFYATVQKQTQKMDFSQVKDELQGVYNMYQGILGRMPDKEGFEAWVKFVNKGMSFEQVGIWFAASKEFQSAAGYAGEGATAVFDFNGILKTLYNFTLGREPDAYGERSWTEWYNQNNKNIGRVITGFTDSVEFIDNHDQNFMGWIANTYGANLKDMDFAALGFDQQEIQSIVPIGVYDQFANDGYSGIF